MLYSVSAGKGQPMPRPRHPVPPGNVDAPVSHRSGNVANDRRLRSTRTVEILSTQKSCGTGEGPLSRCRRPDRVYWMPARARQMPMDLTGSHVHD